MLWEESLVILGNILNSIVTAIPSIIAAAVLLIIGWIIGKILGKITKSILKKANADKYFKFGRGFEISSIFGVAVSWIIYLAFIQAAVEVLGIQALIDFVGKVLAVIPRFLEGIIVILIGYVLAKYIQAQVIATKMEYSEFIGRVIFFLTIIIAIALGLPFFGINPTLINNIILILVGSVGLGIAIALGLGLKDTVAKLAKKYAKKL